MTPFRAFLPRKPLSLLLPTTLTIPLYLTYSKMSTTTSTSPPTLPSTPFPTRPYVPQHTAYPYHPIDFQRQDPSPDPTFYSQPRFVTHIDDNAIALLKQYYAYTLPTKGRILDLCSSWISHFPIELEERAIATKMRKSAEGKEETDDQEQGLEVIGLGMNAAELQANPILHSSILQDLNTTPTIQPPLTPVTATVCVVSIDYLTRPVEVLTSLLECTKSGGNVHLIISNRCFPTKAIGRWLRISEVERLAMVGDYLHFSGWGKIEVVEISDGRGRAGGLRGLMGGGVDPLWVVRGVKGEGEKEGKSEL